ncbi:MAG: chloride channel protein [Pseudomonadota bacterium]
MSAVPERTFLSRLSWRTVNRHRQPVIWCLALLIGTAVGYAIMAFRLLIDFITSLTFGGDETRLLIRVAELPGWQIVAVTTLGGLVVGLVIKAILPELRAGGVADIIEARAIRSGAMPLGYGLKSALVSALSIGAGASVGREGPAAHLGATVGSSIAQALGYSPAITRTLLGAGVAAAVAASFNAPIAGVLFALEVVLGHYALRAFGPIVISSVAASVVTRLHFSDNPAFLLPRYEIVSFWEMPAFALLGAVSAVAAVLFMRSIMAADMWSQKISMPFVLRPALAGFAVGLIALVYPEVLGVGYGATVNALSTNYTLTVLLGCVAAKIVATAISLAGRFGGGVFSPSLFIGAFVGSAFGILASAAFPTLSSAEGAYALVGMGAVAAATLGAPISTTLIVFELVQDYRLSIALLIAASIATVLTQSMLGRSFFHWQIERRGFHISEGPQKVLLETMKISDLMTEGTAPTRDEDGKQLPVLFAHDTLERAFALFEQTGATVLPVAERTDRDTVLGVLAHERALEKFSKALIEANIEEHR